MSRISAKISKPTKAYLDLVKKESERLSEPRSDLLLILDLNGTLVSRNRRNKSMYVRPYSQEFFNYIFDHFEVFIWSSAQKHSIDNMSRIFGPRLAQVTQVWDRSSFGLNTRDFNRKVVTIKDLQKVWTYYGGKYDATNTILLDDSPKKAVLQPYNCIHPTEFEHFSSAFVSSGESELLDVMAYLQQCQLQSNICNYMKEHPYQVTDQFKEKNTWKLEYYLFSDDFEKAPTVVDLSPATEDILVSQMKKVKISNQKSMSNI